MIDSRPIRLVYMFCLPDVHHERNPLVGGAMMRTSRSLFLCYIFAQIVKANTIYCTVFRNYIGICKVTNLLYHQRMNE